MANFLYLGLEEIYTELKTKKPSSQINNEHKRILLLLQAINSPKQYAKNPLNWSFPVVHDSKLLRS